MARSAIAGSNRVVTGSTPRRDTRRPTLVGWAANVNLWRAGSSLAGRVTFELQRRVLAAQGESQLDDTDILGEPILHRRRRRADRHVLTADVDHVVRPGRD